ncbi:ATP-grasp domain-containing protein [Pontibacter rugosus]|uniref:RimK family alpha-L-glutamate ligase n=1 Tax=Pontibacter rugosus TaxID=1745966 RepID=A0ABW3SMW8_9BACT
MNTQQIALITYKSAGIYTDVSEEENSRLYDLLSQKGLNITLEIWDDPAVDWSKYDVVVLKSPWDYFDKITAFYAWLDKLEQLGVRVLNPTSIVRWNTDKRYLIELQEKGVSVVPSLWLEQGAALNVDELFEKLQADKVILKPAISGGAKNTFALTQAEAQEQAASINNLLQQESFLAQPFVPEVQANGEWSFLFFNGEYSHTVLKTAKAGDFRVQHFFGGTVHTPEPPAHLLQTAHNIVDTYAQGCLYARVDGVEVNGQLVLMELELIEPFLFMATNDGAFERYYEALLEQLQASATSIA